MTAKEKRRKFIDAMNIKNRCMLTEHELFELLSSEKKRIEYVLEKTNGNRQKAYKFLNMTERTFYRRLRLYNIPYKTEL